MQSVTSFQNILAFCKDNKMVAVKSRITDNSILALYEPFNTHLLHLSGTTRRLLMDNHFSSFRDTGPELSLEVFCTRWLV